MKILHRHTLKRTSSILLMIGVALACLTACSIRRDKGYFEDEDPEMVAAIATARRTLPLFWQTFEKRDRGETNFSLKIRIVDGVHLEHFWLTNIAREDGKVMGTIEHAPKIVSNVKLGDRLEIPEARIQDWYYQRDGKMIGNQTIRPMMKTMLKTMSVKDSAELKSYFEDP